MRAENGVGPVLERGAVTNAIVAAIRASNTNVILLDRGAYVRVLVPGRCVMPRDALEQELGTTFRLPQDLELVMTSFKGTLTISEDEAVWELSERAL